MTDDEITRFVREGQARLTSLNYAIQQLDAWADAFMLRGGGPVYGNDAALIAGLSNKVQNAIADEDRVTVARLRTDV